MAAREVWQHASQNWLAGGLHLAVGLMAVQANSEAVWPYAVLAFAGISFFAWIGNFSRHRQIRNLPRSKIASAPQGYVALSGRSMLIGDKAVAAPLSGLPCCWYRYRIEERSGRSWSTTEEGVSSSNFVIVDDTGRCVIAPEGAEVIFPKKTQWRDGDTRYTEWVLLPRGLLCALGTFGTRDRGADAAGRRQEIGALLADWKTDRRSLLQRFDSNGNAVIDLPEWEAARQAAAAEVQARHAAAAAQPPEHLLSKPADGRVFLLAAAPSERLGRRFAIWSAVHLVAFGAALVGAWLMFASRAGAA